MDLGADGPDIVLTASTVQGLRWACVELENLGSGLIARGYARDVPAYAVRGFGIDVARRSFSLDFLSEEDVAREDEYAGGPSERQCDSRTEQL